MSSKKVLALENFSDDANKGSKTGSEVLSEGENKEQKPPASSQLVSVHVGPKALKPEEVIRHCPEGLDIPFSTYEFALERAEAFLSRAMSRCVDLEEEAHSFHPFVNKYPHF